MAKGWSLAPPNKRQRKAIKKSKRKIDEHHNLVPDFAAMSTAELQEFITMSRGTHTMRKHVRKAHRLIKKRGKASVYESEVQDSNKRGPRYGN